MLDWIKDEAFWKNLLETFTGYGPLLPILLPFLDCIFPALPLVAFVVFNVNAYGFLLGFTYSYIGNLSGSILMFFLCRKLFGEKIRRISDKAGYVAKIYKWIEHVDAPSVALLLAFPFTPSFFVTLAFALSTYKASKYVLILVFGKAGSILMLSILGESTALAFENPVYILLALALLAALHFLSTFVSRKIGPDREEKEEEHKYEQ